MTLTLKIKLLPTKAQEQRLYSMSREYIALVNDVVNYATGQGSMPKLTTAEVVAYLPSAVKNQALQDAKSVYRKSKKLGAIPVLRKPVCIWNNQNYAINGNGFSFPVFVDGHIQRITMASCITEAQRMVLKDSKLGSLRITTCNGKWVAQVAYEVADAAPHNRWGIGHRLRHQVSRCGCYRGWRSPLLWQWTTEQTGATALQGPAQEVG